jgi:hypothetical protein
MTIPGLLGAIRAKKPEKKFKTKKWSIALTLTVHPSGSSFLICLFGVLETDGFQIRNGRHEPMGFEFTIQQRISSSIPGIFDIMACFLWSRRLI